jgi:preprotein translocase subunit SecY
MVQGLALLLGLGSRAENIFWVKAFPVNAFYYIYMAVVITAGSAFTMWLADLITKHGIGNGSSMIICAGIVASLPSMFSTLGNTYLGSNFSAGNLAKFISIIVIYVLMILAIIWFEGARRRIPVQYANRQGTERSDIPLKLNSAGVIPVIFAQTLLSIPTTIIGMMGLSKDSSTAAYWIDQVFTTTNPIGMVLYSLMIIFFTYFYAFLTIDPEKIGDNLSKQNAFVPGFKPGEETKTQISNILFRVTTIGAIGITLIALVPIIVQLSFGASNSVTMGGTSLLIIVGVAIETSMQIETAADNKDSYKPTIIG